MKWSDVGRAVTGSLPFLGAALGGPAGGAVGVLISKALGVDQTPEAVTAALSPDSLVKLREVEADLQRAQIQADSAAATGQLEVNKVEAANTSLFVAGWRPAIGWTCALAFLWVFVASPIVVFSARMSGYLGAFPTVDISQMMPVLLGLLGLGGMRTLEKIKGVDAGH